LCRKALATSRSSIFLLRRLEELQPLIPSLTTLRLSLRPLQPTDASTLHRISQMEGVLKYFPNPSPPPLEKVEGFILGQESHWEKYGYGNWGILPNDEKEIIGWVGLQYLPGLEETEVGFLLSPDQWGKGYASEAAQASLRFGFEHFELDHIIALVHPENLASLRVVQKCGMYYVETLHLWGIDLMRHRLDNPERKVPS
jgi:[ribosomal protein S5]-alanine N-acetyltransferase